ncbi:MAG: hypothetical protein WHS86_12860 [Desulfosoma sp.]
MKPILLLPVVLIVLGVCAFITEGSVASAEVTFVHEVEAEDLFSGKKVVTLTTGYGADGIYMDQQRQYTGSWMRLLFGGVRRDRRTVVISLAGGDIRELDWGRDKCRIFPLDRLRDPSWIHSLEKPREDLQPLMADRYQVQAPQLTITSDEAEERIGNYRCRHVKAHLRLDTFDRLREAHSVTEVQQDLWLSDEVPGLAESLRVHQSLGDLLGLEKERFGPLSFLLSYWQGPLLPIAVDLEKVRGYPVKSTVRVTAHYIPKEGESKKVSRVVNEETSMLKEVIPALDKALYAVPPHFSTVRVP